MKYILVVSLFVLAGCSQSKPVFEILSAVDSKPLRNHRVVLYNGDVKLKLAKGSHPYPYDFRNKKSWFLDELTTNDVGLLTIEKSYDCHSIVLVIGVDYENVIFSYSSDLGHKKSKCHVRIVDFVPGSTQVKGNFIYDLKTHYVTYIPISGDTTKRKFEYIPIKAILSPDKPGKTTP